MNKKKVSFLKVFWELNKPVRDEINMEKVNENKEDNKLGIAMFVMGASIANVVSYVISSNWYIGLFAGLIGGYLAVTFSSITKKKKIKENDSMG